MASPLSAHHQGHRLRRFYAPHCPSVPGRFADLAPGVVGPGPTVGLAFAAALLQAWVHGPGQRSGVRCYAPTAPRCQALCFARFFAYVGSVLCFGGRELFVGEVWQAGGMELRRDGRWELAPGVSIAPGVVRWQATASSGPGGSM